MSTPCPSHESVSGKFVTLAGERYYLIENVDKIAPFFISLISNSDHWLFISSTGGLTAGRVSPETALFPYVTVDKIHESAPYTGSKTLLRAEIDGQIHLWEPFNPEHDHRYTLSRNLYKNQLGNKLLFEEVNHNLQLTFRYGWSFSDSYGFVRHCELENSGANRCQVEVLDGLQNILPSGTPRFTQTNSSCLVDAYKWSELDEQTGLAFFTLYSGITDRAEPCESLKANTVFCLGLEGHRVLLSSEQLEAFRQGCTLTQEPHTRGIRGAYLVNASLELATQSSQRWQLVAEIDQSQADAVSLRRQLNDKAAVATAIADSVDQGCDELARIMASADGFEATAEETVSSHHYANVLFNVLRGGIFDNQYQVCARDFCATVKMFNAGVYQQHRDWLDRLPAQLDYLELMAEIQRKGDFQLERLATEYLPITFGRRHGDPSRPWNQFAIKLKDDQGRRLLSYQGNWRDIFQNWEALTFSYPEFIESVIAKFVNASTVDGYNPYRITKKGIDWEVEDPEDPWSYIGYWGDHQIIYLQKLLELSQQFHPAQLNALLHKPIFCYANVPYRIKPFEALLKNAKSTVDYDQNKATLIEQRVAELGADGKLVLDGAGKVYQVNLLEKLLVPLLSKLGNLVLDGGIWLNTQRPEWNDANNALVGQGLSMVTLYYMRRYITFLQPLLSSQPSATQTDGINLSNEVAQWLNETAAALDGIRDSLDKGPITANQRYSLLTKLGQAASHYRETLYQQGSFSGSTLVAPEQVTALLDDALTAIDHSIKSNRREDGLYHAYNLLALKPDAADVDTLYPMLEGQVAALSAGAIVPDEAVELLETLFESDIFRPDQNTFMLYPDRSLPGFLDKNRVPAQGVEAIPLLMQMQEQQDHQLVVRDAEGCFRFHAELHNVDDLNARLDSLAPVYGDQVEAARPALQALYEQVFNHKAFTGRSGGMFGFEGLGSIYWHMVSKVLLAVQENFFAAREQEATASTCERLAQLYYRVRDGIGFNKAPAEYGAFPTDPYSHTPKHAGAQQPGMTGQVKEEVLTRFGELGVRVSEGAVKFDPCLLRECEFTTEPREFRFLDVKGQWQTLTVPVQALAFTWCQLPLVYRLDNTAKPGVVLSWDNGEQQEVSELALSVEVASNIFRRSGRIRQIVLTLTSDQLLGN